MIIKANNTKAQAKIEKMVIKANNTKAQAEIEKMIIKAEPDRVLAVIGWDGLDGKAAWQRADNGRHTEK